MKASRILFNKRTKIIQFWIPVKPYVREYPLTSRNQARIERCLYLSEWQQSGVSSLRVYTRKSTR